MEFQKLNSLLKDLRSLRVKRNLVSTEVIHSIEDEGHQGEEGVSFEVYKIEGVDDIYMKLKIVTDSYGDNDSVAGIEFVQPIQKTITGYEPIK